MSDFATLVLAADGTKLKSGEKALDSLTASATKAEQKAGKSLKVVQSSMDEVGKASVANSHRTRMMAMQLSQVAQQASATGNWIQALAIQLPDLALGFGTFGIAAGVAAGALLPLAAEMLGFGDAVEKADDKLNDHIAMIDRAIERYGGAVSALKEYSDELKRQQEINDLTRVTQDAVNRSFAEAREILPDVKGQIGEVISEMIRAGESERSIIALKEAFNETDRAIQDLNQKINDGKAELSDFERVQSAVASLMQNDAVAGSSALQDAIERLGAAYAVAAQQAANFASQTAIATKLTLPKPGMGLRPIYSGGGRLLNEQELMNWRAEHTKSQYEIAAEKAAKRGRRRGHRGPTKEEQEAQREYNRLLSQAKNIYSETRTEAEAYGIELTKLGDLYARGFIDTETYQRAVKQLKDEFNGAAEASKFFSETAYDSIMSLVPAINTGNKALDDFLNTLIKTVMQAVLLGEGPLAKLFGTEGGGLLTSIFGSIFKSYEGGGYTGLGGRYGGMDGKGGFLAMVHPNETIIDHAKPGILAAANNNARPATNGQPQPVEINVNVSGARGNAEIKEMVNQGVAAGLKQYDAKALPGRVVQVSKNPRVRG